MKVWASVNPKNSNEEADFVYCVMMGAGIGTAGLFGFLGFVS
jgi:hypothetical protein